MYKVDLPPDPKEFAKIEARRNREEQRKSRIFDSKQRTIGLDTDALKAQIEEKKQRDADEKEWNAASDAEMLRQAKIMELLHLRQAQDRRAIEKADLDFRATQQLSQTRREFDLNDPDGLKKSLPARVGDGDERLGPSSLQLFHGEDLASADRKRQQAEQQKQWLQEQRAHERAVKEYEEYEKKCQDLQELQQTVHLRDLSAAEESRRQQLVLEAAEFNKSLAEVRAQQAQQAKVDELEANAREMLNLYHGDLLSENPNVATPALGGTVKVLSDRYKGMSEAERVQYRQAQLQQIEETQQRKKESVQENALYDQQNLLVGKTQLLLERQTQRQRQEILRQQMQENAALAAEQKARRELENKARNEIGSQFHEQFNKGSR